MDGQLKGIRQSQTNPKYLHTNSTSHKWPFSAVAELVDNAYDPDVCAGKLDINYESFANHPCLTFTDDGNGLDGDGMHKMLSFGFSEKKDTPKHLAVGQYGNGFKSGSMRIGRDAIVFSNKKNTKTIGFLSQTFLENIKAETVLVPIVSWNLNDNRIIPCVDAEPSLKAILHHSIFKTTDELFAQFKKINSAKGTRIIIYNLKRDNNNRLEFDFLREEKDMIIAEEYASTHPAMLQQNDSDIPEHTYSLRAYCSILFMKPKLRIHLRGKKVTTLFVEKSLSRTERDTYKPKNVKLVPDRPVKITFGFNPKRNQYGILMYHKNRLIKPYVKVGFQTKPDQRGVGILGVVECNFLQPTHNKQDFLDTNVYRSLIQALGNKLNDYWNEKMGIVDVEGIPVVKTEESATPDDNWVQCDRCQKWRKLPPNFNMAAVKRIKEWFCEMNPDPLYSQCNRPEEPEDPDEVRPSYDKTRAKRTAQMIEFQKRAAEDDLRRQQRAKINEEKRRVQQEKSKLQKCLAAQQENKKKREMEALLQKIAVQQEQIRAQEQQIQQRIHKPGTSNENTATYESDDDIQIVDEDEPTNPPPPPLKITKVNQSQAAKRPHTGPAAATPLAAKKAKVSTPKKKAAQTASPAEPPSTPGTPATPTVAPATPTVPPLKITLKPIKIKHKTVHKRIQVGEEQEEALESEDESAEGKQKSKFKVATDSKKFRQSGTQVTETDLSGGCCWVCRQQKIKMEIKQEAEDGTVRVKQEHVSVKNEPGEPHHPGDSLHDVLSEAHGSHEGPCTSKTPSKSNDSAYLQKKVEILTNERNNLRKDVEKLKELSKQNGDLPYNDLQDQLEDSWQKNDDLQKKLDSLETAGRLMQEELDLNLNRSKNANEESDKLTAEGQDFDKRLRAVTEERNLLRSGKNDLESRVQSFTKTLSERLSAQEKEFQNKLKEAQDRALFEENEASDLRKEKESMSIEIEKIKKRFNDEIIWHGKTVEKAKVAQEKLKKDLEDCKVKIQAVLDTQCQQFQDKENALKAQLAEAHRAKGELLQKFNEYQEQIAKVDELNKKQEELKEELAKAKEKEKKVVKILEDERVKHGNQVKQVEEQGRKRLEDCRKEFQTLKAEYEDKQQDITKKLSTAQQELSDAQNKWEDSEKKVREKNTELQTLREQLNQAGNQVGAGGDNQANTQEVLENLRANVFDLLKNLIDQEVDLDGYVNDPRSVQVDEIVQKVLDDNQ